MVLAALAAGGGVLAAEGGESKPSPEMAAMMEAMAKAAEPGEPHRLLGRLEGTWRVQMRMTVGGETIEGRGTALNEMVLGGRFLQSTFKGEMAGQNVIGMGFDGYDNQKQKYIGMWIDTNGTMMMTYEGDGDADGATRTLYGSYNDPASGVEKQFKGVVKVLSTNRYTYEGWEKTADSDYQPVMQLIFSRQ